MGTGAYPGSTAARSSSGADPITTSRPALAAAILLLAGLLLRLSTFGNPDLHVDEAFYFLVGQRMHLGAIPYVDIWDRKPFGLFAIYYLIAAVSRSVVAYQIAAWLFASATAWVIYRVALRWTNLQGAVLAGVIYLALINAFGGDGGQSPVFYNLFIALAALLVLGERGKPGWRTWAAMALAGIAITVKQTAFFEAAFLGLYALHGLHRGGTSPRRLAALALGFAIVGAAPSLAITGWYVWAGHWHEFWHAMVLANLEKSAFTADVTSHRLVLIAVRAIAIAVLVGWSLARRETRHAFLTGWLIAALAGFVAVPTFADHYTLPLMVPASVAAGLVFGQAATGRIAFVAALLFYLFWHDPSDFARARESRLAMDRLAALVRDHDGGGGLLVYDGPPLLYVAADKQPLSPLAFPHHLGQLVERDVSHLNTAAEIDRILAALPGVIVSARYPRTLPVNADSYRKIRAYAATHCRVAGVVPMRESGVTWDTVVLGDCR